MFKRRLRRQNTLDGFIADDDDEIEYYSDTYTENKINIKNYNEKDNDYTPDDHDSNELDNTDKMSQNIDEENEYKIIKIVDRNKDGNNRTILLKKSLTKTELAHINVFETKMHLDETHIKLCSKISSLYSNHRYNIPKLKEIIAKNLKIRNTTKVKWKQILGLNRSPLKPDYIEFITYNDLIIDESRI